METSPRSASAPESNNGGYYISPLIPGRGIRSFAQGGKLGWIGGDSDAARPAAGMTSAQLNQRLVIQLPILILYPLHWQRKRPLLIYFAILNYSLLLLLSPDTENIMLLHLYDRHGNGKARAEIDCDCHPAGHIPGYTGSILHDGHEHVCAKMSGVAAGVSTMELCPDEHESVAPPVQKTKTRDTVSDLLHAHGHPDHIIDQEDDRSSVASEASENGYLSAHLPKGKAVIRCGKLVQLPREVEDSPPPAGIASLVHARTTNLNILSGPSDAADNGINRDAKVSGQGGRVCIRGGKLIKVAGNEDQNLVAAGVRTGELDKKPR